MQKPKLKAFYDGHSRQMYIVWSHYDNKPEKHGFIVYRNGLKIAEHTPQDEKWEPFMRCSQFDNDHNTNLFHKYDRRNELVYVDRDLPMYQQYEYRIEKIRYNDEGKIVGSVMSRPVYVKTE